MGGLRAGRRRAQSRCGGSEPGRRGTQLGEDSAGAPHPWPAFRCRLISFSPSIIHCMIFWFFSASSDGPGASVLLLFPSSAFLEFLLEVVPTFPLQEQDLVTCYFSRPRLDGWPGPAGLGRTASKGPACMRGLSCTPAGTARLFWADSVDRRHLGSSGPATHPHPDTPSETGPSDPTALQGWSPAAVHPGMHACQPALALA